jgi:hypothetical protein
MAHKRYKFHVPKYKQRNIFCFTFSGPTKSCDMIIRSANHILGDNLKYNMLMEHRLRPAYTIRVINYQTQAHPPRLPHIPLRHLQSQCSPCHHQCPPIPHLPVHHYRLQNCHYCWGH